MPSWLKILVVLLALMFVFSIIGAFSEAIIGPVVIMALIMFPGSDPKNPTFFKIFPFLAGLEWLTALVFLCASLAGKNLLPAEANVPTTPELALTIILTPLLLAAFLKRHRAFIPFMLTSTIIMIGFEGWKFYDGMRTGRDVIELVSSLVTDGLIAAYMYRQLKKWPWPEASAKRTHL